MLNKQLSEAIVALAMDLPEQQLETLAAAVAKVASAHAAQALPSLARSNREESLRRRLIDAWSDEEDVTSDAVALALRAAAQASRTSKDAQSVDLVWSGPFASTMAARRTDQALVEIVRSAMKKITLVTFVTAKLPDQILKDLSDAADRGVELRLVFESDFQGGKLAFDPANAVGDLMQRVGIHLYHWPVSRRPRSAQNSYGSLHAKCVVSDAQKALVSSANLTGYAMELNIELGVLISGGELPARLETQFDRFIADGTWTSTG